MLENQPLVLVPRPYTMEIVLFSDLTLVSLHCTRSSHSRLYRTSLLPQRIVHHRVWSAWTSRGPVLPEHCVPVDHQSSTRHQGCSISWRRQRVAAASAHRPDDIPGMGRGQ